MATTTQNLGLIKPAGTDKIRIAQINSNMDTLDTKIGPVGNTPLQTQATNAASSISALQSGIAIICNGNTHVAIAAGRYVYVRNHSSLAEGLYVATSLIQANGSLSTSNLAAVSGGALNALLAQIPEQLVHIGTETDYPLSAAHTAYPMGVTLIYTAANTSYPYGTGTVATIRAASARCVQFSFGNSPNSYKLRTADSSGWSGWKTYTGS